MFGFIYITKNLITNTFYVGQSTCLYKKTYIGSGRFFMRAVKKYGKNNFTCKRIAEAFSQKELDDLEIALILMLRSSGIPIYNLANGGVKCSMKGFRHTKESRNKMSAAKIGRKQSIAHVENMKKALRARRPHPNSIAALLVSNRKLKGAKRPEVSKRMKGSKLSAATRKKLSVYGHSQACLDKLKKARSTLANSPEAQFKIAESNRKRAKLMPRDPKTGRILPSNIEEHEQV